MNLNPLSLLGESTSPFIDEGDGLTSERERVRMLLNLVAHTGRYRMMVGAHNTVGCRIHGKCSKTSHMHLTLNSVVGAYHHPVPAGVGNKA